MSVGYTSRGCQTRSSDLTSDMIYSQNTLYCLSSFLSLKEIVETQGD